MRMETKFLEPAASTVDRCEFADPRSCGFSQSGYALNGGPSSTDEDEDDAGCRPKKLPKSGTAALGLSNHNLPQAGELTAKKSQLQASSSTHKSNQLLASTPSAPHRRRTGASRSDMESDEHSSIPERLTTTSSSSSPASGTGTPAASTNQPTDSACLKVPPLRIVISSTAGRSNLKETNGGGGGSDSFSSGGGSGANLTTSRNYVVSSATFEGPDSSVEGGNAAANTSSTVLSTASSSPESGGHHQPAPAQSSTSASSRVTRSQRAAAQHHAPAGEENSRGSPLDGDASADTGVGDCSMKSEKESNKENKEHRKRKGRARSNAIGSAANVQTSIGQSNAASAQPGGQQPAGSEPNVEEDTDSMSSSHSGSTFTTFAMPSYNCQQMYQAIRRQVDRRRQSMCVANLAAKPPAGFNRYLMYTQDYTLDGQATADGVGRPASAPERADLSDLPQSLHQEEQLAELYRSQATEREQMRTQHRIEKEHLKLSTEQEIVRVHGRAALAQANQSQPLSFATIMRDEEIYNTIDGDADEKCMELLNATGSTAPTSTAVAGPSAKETRNEYSRATYSCVGQTGFADLYQLTGKREDLGSRCRFSGRLLHSWLQDVEDKWAKVRKETLARHRHEAESLQAIQKLHWGWRVAELARQLSLRLPMEPSESGAEAADRRRRHSQEWTKLMQDEQLVPLVPVGEDIHVGS